MVMAVGALKDGRLDHVETDIWAVVEAAWKVPVKVIIGTSYGAAIIEALSKSGL